MSPDNAFKEMTRRAGVVLREHGFKGSGQNFKRDMGEQWQGINFQKSQWRVDRGEPIDFYLNLALHFPGVTFERHTTPATFAAFTPMKSDQQFRVGDFLWGCDDGWLSIDGATIEPFWERFAPLLTESVVPVMDRMSSREGLAETCRRVPWGVSFGARQWLGPGFAMPAWDPKDRDAGRWKQDEEGLWWGPGEW